MSCHALRFCNIIITFLCCCSCNLDVRTRNLRLQHCLRLRHRQQVSRLVKPECDIRQRSEQLSKCFLIHMHACLSPIQWANFRHNLLSKRTLMVFSLVDKYRAHLSLCLFFLLPIVFLSIFISLHSLSALYFQFSGTPEDYLRNEPQRENKHDNKSEEPCCKQTSLFS